MWPIGPSLDVRAYDWLKRNDRKHLRKYFPKIKTLSISSFLVGYGAVLFGTAWLTKNEALFEYASLSLETVAIVQFYHSVTKLLVGRQSPYQAEGEPGIYGPTRLHFPGGTPSGHGATIWALMFVLADYYKKWPLYVLAFAGGIYASTSLVYRRQHYISDVVWGTG